MHRHHCACGEQKRRDGEEGSLGTLLRNFESACRPCDAGLEIVREERCVGHVAVSVLVVPGSPVVCGSAGSQVVRIPGLHSRPLDDGASIDPVRVLAFRPLRPTGRRVLPRLLPPVDGQVEQPIAVTQRLDAASRRPVSLKNLGALPQVANDVHHAYSTSNQEGLERVPGGRVPRHLPAHEVAVPGTRFIRALAERGVGDVARMNKGQLADLRCIYRCTPRTAPAQGGRYAT